MVLVAELRSPFQLGMIGQSARFGHLAWSAIRQNVGVATDNLDDVTLNEKDQILKPPTNVARVNPRGGETNQASAGVPPPMKGRRVGQRGPSRDPVGGARA